MVCMIRSGSMQLSVGTFQAEWIPHRSVKNLSRRASNTGITPCMCMCVCWQGSVNVPGDLMLLISRLWRWVGEDLFFWSFQTVRQDKGQNISIWGSWVITWFTLQLTFLEFHLGHISQQQFLIAPMGALCYKHRLGIQIPWGGFEDNLFLKSQSAMCKLIPKSCYPN